MHHEKARPSRRSPENAPIVSHYSDQVTIEANSGQRWRQLLPARRDAAFLRITFPPNQHADQTYVSHPAKEYLYLICGTLQVDISGNVQTLHAGDSIAFAAHAPHRMWNVTSRSVSALRFTAHL